MSDPFGSIEMVWLLAVRYACQKGNYRTRKPVVRLKYTRMTPDFCG